jgi:uncharacterized protein YcbK (DUF882 family)
LKSASALGDDRTILLHHVHTKENLAILYKKNGKYDEDALKKINWIMRDWRKDQAIKMDPEAIDMLWEVHREVGAKEPINIICGYRSPETNSMLRRRSKGVAKFSQHMLGKAIDFYIPGVPLDKVRAASLRLQGGGVGYYPASGSPFVHVDVGSVRHWPRMTREQLAKVFPDGRTVHVPTDGQPMAGYQLALADLERGHRTAAAPKKRSLIASLFGLAQDSEETEDKAAVRQNPTPAPNNAPTAPARTLVASAAAPESVPVPLPRSRPIYQVASVESRPTPAPAARPPEPVKLAALSPNDIIGARGYWDGQPDASPAVGERRETDLASARQLLARSLSAASGHDLTSAVGPFAIHDRVPPDVALAYAAQAQNRTLHASLIPVAAAPTAVVARKGSASVAIKPAEPVARSQAARPTDRLADPWVRGVVLAASVQNSLTVTRVGDPDFKSFAGFMHRPESVVVMTFAQDPHLGMVAENFAGSAVVFQATVTFGERRTAALQ